MSCPEATCRLTYETLLDDELVIILMERDGVTRAELERLLLTVAAAREGGGQDL